MGGFSKLKSFFRAGYNERECRLRLEELDRQRAFVSAAEGRLGEMEEVLLNRERSLSDFERQLRESEAQINYEKEDLQKRERRIEELAERILQGREDRTEMDGLKGRLASLQAENAALKLKAARFFGELDARLRSIESLNVQKSELEARLKYLSGKLEAQSAKVTSLERSNKALSDELSAMQGSRTDPPSSGKWVDLDEIVTVQSRMIT